MSNDRGGRERERERGQWQIIEKREKMGVEEGRKWKAKGKAEAER